MINSPSATSSLTILRQLSIEWEHRTISARDLRHARSWQLPGQEISSLDDILDRCGFIRAGVPGLAAAARRRQRASLEAGDAFDAYVLRLLVLARTDELAARIVLQRILPALTGLARRHAAAPSQVRELIDDLVANAWASIRTYPVERRPHWVVSNLVRDIGFTTIMRPLRRRSADECATSADHFLDLEAPDRSAAAIEELAELLRDALDAGVIDDADVELLRQLLHLGQARRVAAVREVSPRTVRNHRDAIVHRLRSNLELTAAA